MRKIIGKVIAGLLIANIAITISGDASIDKLDAYKSEPVMEVLAETDVTSTVVKASVDTSDTSVAAYEMYYMTYISEALRQSYEKDGGVFKVFPPDSNYNGTQINDMGWSKDYPTTTTGYCDLRGAYPVIALTAKVVDQPSRYYANTDKKVIVHEFGHYVNAKANKIRTGSYSYNESPEFENAFKSELANYASSSLSDTFKSSFKRTTASYEYYATIYAAMMLEPQAAMAAFPASCALVMQDIALVEANI